ncbi:hypothetical protein IFM89_035150 [Coptis chinensis]|uniref:Uncharacterized protein n=1 Tax=Coptis chinensis TaxID=261450 RepID=A0A835IUJ5_9MAGN|nr:hypothetical protein IFM89_035150 [Coptis chinensis]
MIKPNMDKMIRNARRKVGSTLEAYKNEEATRDNTLRNDPDTIDYHISLNNLGNEYYGGWNKISFDGSFNRVANKGPATAICRDADGKLLGSVYRKISAHNPYEAECHGVELVAILLSRLKLDKVRAVHSGTTTLKDATSKAITDWATEKWGGKPDVLVACVGGGSNVMGLFHEFVDDSDVRLIRVEAAGHGVDSGMHAPGISASPFEETMQYFNVMILGPTQSLYEGRHLGMGTNMHPSSALLGQNKDESIAALPIDDL